jgi:D-alanine-D-alanine ligase
MSRLHVTVMLGGPSAEREVSLRSGRAVTLALLGLGHWISWVDPRTDTLAVAEKCDVGFLALHGTYGEDGTVQRRLEELGVAYTGCNADASRIAFDKVETKRRCVAAGVPTPRFTVVNRPGGVSPGLAAAGGGETGAPGLQRGLMFVERVEDWREALGSTLKHDTAALVEERVRGREVTVGILAGEALPVVEIRPKEGGYDYQNKYTEGATEYLCPAPFDRVTTERIQALGMRAFEAVNGRDYGRVDVMVREDGQPLVLEVNTLPGMTETSLLPKAAAAVGLSFGALCAPHARVGRETGDGSEDLSAWEREKPREIDDSKTAMCCR